MATRYDILPPEQRRLLSSLAGLEDLGFVLYGDTAIALQLGHRTSIDFDFFSDRPIDQSAIVQRVPELAAASILRDEKNSWTLLTEIPGEAAVKLSFFGGLGFGRVGHPSRTDDGILALASLDDLLGHKLKVLLQRAEAKDYLDIVAMLRSGQTLEQGLGASLSLFGNFPLCEALKALVYFSDGDLGTVSDVDRRILIDHADRFAMPMAMPILSNRLAADLPP